MKFASYFVLSLNEFMENYLTFVVPSTLTKCFLNVGNDESLKCLQSKLLKNSVISGLSINFLS
ncbi:MAG: hypothetical protein ACD_79C00224G0002 [uncultured bacterium]|nr:MAG: hypothetical protein ACD_79C00224G0002 [uncultured bacterium]